MAGKGGWEQEGRKGSRAMGRAAVRASGQCPPAGGSTPSTRKSPGARGIKGRPLEPSFLGSWPGPPSPWEAPVLVGCFLIFSSLCCHLPPCPQRMAQAESQLMAFHGALGANEAANK